MILTKNRILLTSFVILVLIKVNCALNGDKKQDAKCLLPLEPGPCRMSLTRFYYDAKTDTCEEFKFGGCKGNDNKFGFKQTCEAACKKQALTTSSTEKTITNIRTAATSTNAPQSLTAGATTAKITSSKVTTSKPKP